MKKVFGLFLLAFLLSAHAQPCLAESERHFPSRPYFDSVETELDSLLSLSFVRERFISPVNRAAEEPLLGPDDDRYFTPDDIKTIQHDWPMYIRSIVQKIFDTLLARGIDPDGYGSVYELLAEFFSSSDRNSDGVLTKDEARGMILNILPFGITRALVLDYISRKPKDEMIPKILQDLEKELKPEGGLRKIIHELCDAGVITGKLCELPMLPEAQ